MSRGRGENAVVGRLAGELAGSEAHRDHRNSREPARETDRVEEVGRVRSGFDQVDARGRRDRMRPLDVERRLECPARVIGLQSGLDILREGRRSGQSVLGVERGEVRGDARVVVRLDDRDRLTGPVSGDRSIERDLVHAVGGLDLSGGQARGIYGASERRAGDTGLHDSPRPGLRRAGGKTETERSCRVSRDSQEWANRWVRARDVTRGRGDAPFEKPSW